MTHPAIARKIAIITAKGRSRRLPGKNIRPFFGKPIIAYSIEGALASGLFDTVMVSTDSEEIADISRHYGAEVPFLRSAEAAGDNVMLYEVVQEVLNEYEKRGQTFDWLCCMLPTAVFITGEKLRDAWQRLEAAPEADGLYTVVRFADPIQRALQLDEQGRVSMVWPEHLHSVSNDLPPRFHDGGQFWWMRTSALFAQNKLYADHALGMEVPEFEAIDLDNETDWRMAELKYQLYAERQRDKAAVQA